MAYGWINDLPRRATSDLILRNKIFHTAKYPKYDGYQRGLASMVNTFFKVKILLDQKK